MTKVEQMEAELRKLWQAELRQIRESLDDMIEDDLQFTPDFDFATQLRLSFRHLNMKIKLPPVALAALLFAGLSLASSSAYIGISVGIAPPAIPIYE